LETGHEQVEDLERFVAARQDLNVDPAEFRRLGAVASSSGVASSSAGSSKGAKNSSVQNSNATAHAIPPLRSSLSWNFHLTAGARLQAYEHGTNVILADFEYYALLVIFVVGITYRQEVLLSWRARTAGRSGRLRCNADPLSARTRRG
jgi:hypothetical protein